MMSQWYGVALDSHHKIIIFDDFKDKLLAQVQPFAFGQKDIVYTVSDTLTFMFITHTLRQDKYSRKKMLEGTHPAIWLSNHPLPDWVLQADHWMKNLVIVTLPDRDLFGECICEQDAQTEYEFNMNFDLLAATPDLIESDATMVNDTLPPSSAPRDESPEIQSIEEWEWEAALASQQQAEVLHFTNVFLDDVPL